MSTTELDPQQERRKKTTWLLAVGGASLLLPLAGIAYVHWSEANAPTGPGEHSDVFERRDGLGPLKPSQTVVPNAMSATANPGGAGASSLDFIRAGADYRAAVAAPVSTAAAVAAVAAAPAPAAAPSPAPAATKKPAANGKKAFVMPKLQPTRGFSNFGKGTTLPTPGAANPAPAAGGGDQATQQMLQNLPPGAQNNPDIQKYLQSQQGQQGH
jgi:hypothetical protein